MLYPKDTGPKLSEAFEALALELRAPEGTTDENLIHGAVNALVLRNDFLARLDKIFKRHGEIPTRDLNEIARRVERDNPPHDELKRHRQCFRELAELLNLDSGDPTESIVEAVRSMKYSVPDGMVITDRNGDTLDWGFVEGVVEVDVVPHRDANHQTAYLQHGEIIPVTVLYGDDTTTLVRTPDTDMMLETSTAVWHTEQEYRLQELVKAQPGLTSNQVATAVRILNDLIDAGDVVLADA